MCHSAPNFDKLHACTQQSRFVQTSWILNVSSHTGVYSCERYCPINFDICLVISCKYTDIIQCSHATRNVRHGTAQSTPLFPANDIQVQGVMVTRRIVPHVVPSQFNPHGKEKHYRWRHNEHDGVSNHQPHLCLLNRLFRRRSKKTSKLRVTGLCVGNSPVTGEFPAQRASNAE